jgi:hypothetical protein
VVVPIFCSFCFSEKLHKKYSRNWTKRKPKFLFTWHEDGVQRRDGERPGGSHTIGWCGLPPGHVEPWCGPLGRPLTSPFRLQIPFIAKTLYAKKGTSTKHTVSRRRHRPKIRRVQKLFPAPYQRGESSPEAFYITMPASGVIVSSPPLDHGSIAVARWLSSPPCASCLDLVSCLSWSRSSLRNSTCCVC